MSSVSKGLLLSCLFILASHQSTVLGEYRVASTHKIPAFIKLCANSIFASICLAYASKSFAQKEDAHGFGMFFLCMNRVLAAGKNLSDFASNFKLNNSDAEVYIYFKNLFGGLGLSFLAAHELSSFDKFLKDVRLMLNKYKQQNYSFSA